MAIAKQELHTDVDSNGMENYYLRTTVDCREAIEAAKLASEMGGRIGKGSDEIVVSAQIPNELYSLDPLLKTAMAFLRMGDRAMCVHYTRMFLKLNPWFKVNVRKKYF